MIPLLAKLPVFILLNIKERQEQVEKEGLSFLTFKEVKTMKEYIKEKLKGEEVHILAKQMMVKEMAEQLIDVDEIKTFSFDIENPQSSNQTFSQLKRYLVGKMKMGKTSFEDTMKEWHKKANKKIIKSRLPNIVFLNEDGWKANILLTTMFAMVNQKTNKKQIMTKLF